MKRILDKLNEKQRRKSYIKKHYIDLYNDIILYGTKMSYDISFTELLYNYRNDTVKNVCVVCGNKTNFINYKRGYRDYCSKKCSMSDPDILNKRNAKTKETLMREYGVDNVMKLEETKKKIRETNIEKYGKEYYFQTNDFDKKSKSTNMEKYGKEYYLQSDEFFDKKSKTCIEKYGVDNYTKSQVIKNKSKKTKKLKYGDEYYNNIDKSKETSVAKYGEEHHMTYKKKNNLLDSFYKKKSDNYYKEKIKNQYKILDIRGNELIIKHKLCGEDFMINKQLYYLRDKSNIEICTKCNKVTKPSSYMENDLYDFINDNYNGEIQRNIRKVLDNKYELDIYLPELNLAFEFNGLYWHNELNKDNNYHKEKTELCEENSIQLIHVWEDDWEYRQEIVKSMILNKLNLNKTKIYGRKTEIKEINDNKLIRDFLNNNHIQGFVGSSIKIGLYYNGELVSLMTFGKKRKMMNSGSKEGEFEMLRFCNKINTTVIGGASKLFKYFIENYNFTEILTYADRSHSNGNLYKTLGFDFVSKTQPNYHYIINKIRYHRFGFRKDVLIKEGFDPNKTEHEIMLERKIYRIYNSGNLKYIYVNNSDDKLL